VCAEQLDRKVRELYDAACRLEDEKYDWEMKLIRQNAEVSILPDNMQTHNYINVDLPFAVWLK